MWSDSIGVVLLCVSSGGKDDALESFDRAMEPETQGSSLTYFGYLAACRCDTLIALGRFQEALIDAEIASRLCPDAPEGNIARGRALMALGRGNEALDAYEAAIDRADDPLSEELTAERDRAAAFVLSNQLSPAELQ